MARELIDPAAEVRTHLLQDVRIQTLVGKRVFGESLPPKGTAFPCVTLSIEGGPNSIRTLDKGHTALFKPVIMIIGWGNSEAEASRVARAIDARMMEAEEHGFIGQMRVGGLWRSGMTEGRHPELEKPQSVREWTIQGHEWT